MKLKTKAKILSGLLAVSSVIGYIIPNGAHAIDPPTDIPPIPIPDSWRRDVRLVYPGTFMGYCAEAEKVLRSLTYYAGGNDAKDKFIEEFDKMVDSEICPVRLKLSAEDITCESAKVGMLSWAMEAATQYYYLTNNHGYIDDVGGHILDNISSMSPEALHWFLCVAVSKGRGWHHFVQDTLALRPDLVNVNNPPSGTLLHIAVWFRHTRMIRILINRGANPNIPNYYGLTPYSMAKVNSDDSIAKALHRAQRIAP